MRLKRQIYLGFAVVVMFPLLSALWTIRATRLVDERISHLTSFFPILKTTNDIPLQVKAIQNKFIDVALDPEEEGLQQCRDLVRELETSLNVLSHGDNDAEVANLRLLAGTYVAMSVKMLEAMVHDQADTYNGDAEKVSVAAAALTTAVTRFRNRINNDFADNLAHVARISSNTRIISWTTSLAAFMTGSFLAAIFAGYFSQQDRRLREVNDALGVRYQELATANDLLQREIAERTAVEEKLRRSLSYEEALSEVSGLFAGTFAPDTRQVAKVLCEAVSCDLAFVIGFDASRRHVEHHVEWVRPSALGSRPDAYNLDMRGHPTWLKRLGEDDNVVVPDTTLDRDPDTAPFFWQELNLRSLALVPVTSHQNDLQGYMGVAHFREPRVWTLEPLRLLRVACEMRANYLARTEAEDRLKYDAFHDNLTGLPNRSLFMDRLTHLIDRNERHPDERFAVLFLDLDRFKPINDSMGHPVGDQLLVHVARELERCVRQQDTVARMGGDEFTILLEEISSTEEVQVVARRILQRLAQPIFLGDMEVHTSASIGVKLCTHLDLHPDNVVRDADIAMYEAKNRGKSRFVIFQDAMHRQTTRVVQMENDLRKAVERGELMLYYQPILDFGDGRIVGFEALLRWNHGRRGMISPAEFIPLAEETGLILPIGLWVLREACTQTQIWQQQGFPDLSISVNVSAPQFYEKDLHEKIDAILRDTGLPATSLHLELTEGLLMENVDLNIAMLRNFNDMGISISVDDFGTGYSSLSYLKRFPLQTLKVDQSFVRDLPDSADDSAITAAIIALGRSLNLNLVAEGVETQAQFDFLKARGCQKFQGFLISGPVPAPKAEALLRGQTCPST